MCECSLLLISVDRVRHEESRGHKNLDRGGRHGDWERIPSLLLEVIQVETVHSTTHHESARTRFILPYGAQRRQCR